MQERFYVCNYLEKIFLEKIQQADNQKVFLFKIQVKRDGMRGQAVDTYARGVVGRLKHIDQAVGKAQLRGKFEVLEKLFEPYSVIYGEVRCSGIKPIGPIGSAPALHPPAGTYGY